MVQMIFFLLLIFSNAAQAKVDAVICQGKIYSIDYLLINNQKPYGPLIEDNDIPTATFPYLIFITAIFDKAAPELRPALGIFFNNLRNESDLSQPMAWQGSALSLPKEILSLKDWPALAHCAVNEKIEALSVVQPIVHGQSIIFEYDQKLMALIKQSNLQLSFLYIGTFLRLINQDLTALFNINGLIHSLPTLGLPPDTLNALFAKYGMVKRTQENGTCNRSHYVISALQKSTGLPCEIMESKNLLEIETLNIESDRSERPNMNYKSMDFKGLLNVKELSISGFSNDVKFIPENELSVFKKVKKLAVTNSDIDLPPMNFMNSFTGLTHLDLSNNSIYEFKENAFRKIFIQETGTSSEVTLDLSNNNSYWSPRKRVYVHPGTFNNCQAVTRLLMPNMNLTKLDGSVFLDLISLEELDLSKNPIREFPWEILTLPKLKTIHYCANEETKKVILDEMEKKGRKIDFIWCDHSF